MNYCDWRRKVIESKDYEKLRLFQFQAISTLGSFVLGLAALFISVNQITASENDKQKELVEKRRVELEREISTASGMMKSTGFDKYAEP
jgi:protein-arginine kinase